MLRSWNVRQHAARALGGIGPAAEVGFAANTTKAYIDTGAQVRAKDDVEADADAPTGATRSTNGGRSRTKAASTSAPAG